MQNLGIHVILLFHITGIAALAGRDSPERQERLASILAKVDDQNLEVVRVAFVDTHGIVRMRTIEAPCFPRRHAMAFRSPRRYSAWAQKCGRVLSDPYFSSGERCPFDPGLIMETACERLSGQGLTHIGGTHWRISQPRTPPSYCGVPSGRSAAAWAWLRHS
jgi:hypothetical protein